MWPSSGLSLAIHGLEARTIYISYGFMLERTAVENLRALKQLTRKNL